MRDGLRPSGTDTLGRHFWLTRSVARVTGVNLSSAMSAGALHLDDYVDMVERCQGCAFRTMCESWLAQQADLPAAPPSFCAHVDILNTLRRGQTQH